jgi:hypothetical protein
MRKIERTKGYLWCNLISSLRSVEPSHYNLPELHKESGILKNALDIFYYWVEDHVKSASEEKKCCRNKMILLDSHASNPISKIEQRNTTNGRALEEK